MHKQYKDVKTGEVINGDQLREFLDWQEKPNAVRYARFMKGKELITYFDSDLVPVEEAA